MRILLAPGAAEGGKVEVVEDLEGAMGLLAQRGNIDASLLPKEEQKETKETKTEEDEAKAAAALAERADEAGRTVEEQTAHEATDEYKAEVAAAELQERATANNRTVEEQQTFEEEEAAKAAEQLPEFTDEQKTWMKAQGLLDDDGNLVKPTEEADTTELKTKLAAAEAKATELETKLTEKGGGVAVTVAPMHRFFTLDTATDLDKEEQSLETFKEWCMANWDGVKETEASEDGKVKAQPGYTAEQVRQAYQRTEKLLEKTLPTARAVLQQHQAENAEAKKVYPTLFDSKHSDYAVVQAILKKAPGLRALFPNVMTILGDAMAGERARVAEAKKKATLAKGGKGAPIAKPAPKIGIGAKPAPAGAAAAKGKGLNVARFEELGGDRGALATAIQEGLLN